jgi:DNA-binding NarL/FixJ family response regulator
MKFQKLKYDTVREVCFAPEDIARLSDALQAQDAPCHFSHLIAQQPDPVRLAQVKDVIETAVTGRKYEVLLLRSQGKTYSEIALLLSISKSAVQHHYRRAVHQVRLALGVGHPSKHLYDASQTPV